ncbi:MAG: hypothetical protein J6T30_05475, partial [Bacteroidales bacterium]|nr:hypothetical protein [Bacteroidales bacterium]
MEDNNVAQQRYELIQSMRNKILSVPQMNKQQLKELSYEFLHYLDIYSDSLIRSDIYYFLGSCYSFQGEDSTSINWYKKVLLYKESLGVVDIHYMNALYNLSVLYYNNGDDKEALVYCDKYCSHSEEVFNQIPNRILQGYMMAILISTEMMEADTFYEYSAKSISMLANHEGDFNPTDLGNFYLAIGSGYYATNDFNNARVYYEKAEQFFSKSDMSNNSIVDNYLILLASLAKVYEKMELDNKILGCYTKGLKLPVPSNSFIVVLFYDSYAAYLNSIGQIDAGEEVVYNAMQLTKRQNPNSKYHILAVSCYASYLATYKNDLKTASEYYKQCMTYCDSHPDDYYLKESVARTYYKVLLAEGETTKALSLVQDLLFASLNQTYDNLYENPEIEGYSIVNRVLYLFRGKYAILKQMYMQTDDVEMLKYATEVNSIIISIIEKMRIGAEIESDKLYLGQSTGDSYESIISDYYTLYYRTGEKKYLSKAFEYSEKGTAASLLATFRETNASQFHLPKEISDLEASLRNDIVYYSSMMDDPFNSGKDIIDASGYGDKIMSSIYKLDSLLVS